MLVHQESTAALDCSKCGRKFRKPGSHIKHEAHCQQTPSLPCSRCDAKFPTQEQLRRHSKNHVGERFHCNVCNKTFTHSNGFTQHKKSHTDERYWFLRIISIFKLAIFQASMPQRWLWTRIQDSSQPKETLQTPWGAWQVGLSHMWKEICGNLEPETPRDDSLGCKAVQMRRLSKEVHKRERYGGTQTGTLWPKRVPMCPLSFSLHPPSWIATAP